MSNAEILARVKQLMAQGYGPKGAWEIALREAGEK